MTPLRSDPPSGTNPLWLSHSLIFRPEEYEDDDVQSGQEELEDGS